VGLIIKQVAMLLMFVFASVSTHGYDKEFNLNSFAQTHFPQADRFEQNHDLNVVVAYKKEQAIGYSFTNDQIISIPAYSGKPINSIIAMDAAGDIVAAELLEHHEPILLVGIPETELEKFVNAFVGFNVTDQVRVGSGDGDNTIDAITGATVTVMVVNEAIMKAASKVAKHFHVAGLEDNRDQQAKIKSEHFEQKTWQDLVAEGAINRLSLLQEDINDAFTGTEAEEQVEHENPDNQFVDLYFTLLNIPSIGRNLLGDSEYNYLMTQALKPGDMAFAVMANGEYSFKGNGYVRGGIFDRTQLHQNSQVTIFRDLDYLRLSDVYIEGFPGFSEMAIFISRAKNEFDVGSPWQLELLVRRQKGPIESIFQSFYAGAEPLEEYIQRPDPHLDLPLWQRVWYDRAFQTGVVIAALVLLMAIIFLQDYLVKYPKFLKRLHMGYLVFTVFFIGWYSLGQLSVVNVFTFISAVYTDFHWDLFLLDPVIFSIWGFVAVSLLLWGRGIYCGWLCPFGAIQELVNEFSRKINIKQFELPYAVHERLWAIKYIILLGLFGLSLESLSLAERFAEVEPFKTTIMLKFQREWGYVFYALLLIVISIFNRKFYCRYICPLGAALAIPARISLFDWLRRRKECGDPCQLCAVECEIQAIDRDGKINPNECHYCLDCQMTYYDDKKCPPLVNKRKKKIKKSKQDKNRIEIHEVV
jgi:NosR/NirI family nitrous oxide reductase transcriptional regulator